MIDCERNSEYYSEAQCARYQPDEIHHHNLWTHQTSTSFKPSSELECTAIVENSLSCTRYTLINIPRILYLFGAIRRAEINRTWEKRYLLFRYQTSIRALDFFKSNFELASSSTREREKSRANLSALLFFSLRFLGRRKNKIVRSTKQQTKREGFDAHSH